MKTTMRGLAFCAIALAACCANAGTIEQAHVFAQPQMNVKDGVVQACGYRVKSAPRNLDQRTPVIALDVSFLVSAQGQGLMKGGAVQLNGGSDPVVRPIKSFWVKALKERPSTALGGKIFPSEDKGYVIYGEKAEVAMQLFVAVASRESLTIGAQIKGEPVDRIYTGVAEITDAQIQQVLECLGDVSRQLQGESGENSTSTGR